MLAGAGLHRERGSSSQTGPTGSVGGLRGRSAGGRLRSLQSLRSTGLVAAGPRCRGFYEVEGEGFRL